MFDNYLYDDETIAKNEGKIEPFSLLLGMGVGIIDCSIQAFTHYVTNNPADSAFLGMSFIDGVLGSIMIVTIWLGVRRKFYADRKKELLKTPEKKDK